MYPDLSYFFHDVFGSPVDNWTSIFKSFGLMLGIAFLACAWLVRNELIRLEKIGLVKAMQYPNPMKQKAGLQDIITNSLVTLIIAAKLPYIINHFADFKADPASIIFSAKGSWAIGLLAGLAYAIFLYVQEQKRDVSSVPSTISVSPHQKTMDIILLAAISGVVCSRLFSIFENMEDFFRDPLGQLFSGSGLTVYGGLILAFITVYWYVKKNGIKPIYMMDIAGMGILLGYGIGRIGCQIAGDGDWGIVAAAQPEWWFLPDWLWSYHYPNNVSNDGVTIAGCNADLITTAKGTIEERCQVICGMRYCHQLEPAVYPTPVYETLISMTGFGLLFMMRNKIKIAGMTFFLYMIYNGIERFFIEQIRVNERYDFLGLNWSQAQYISVGFILGGIAGLVYLSKKKPGWENESKSAS
ncbi:MAG: prolipoprotein diacylglyceryl transferase [Saprospiraceae bacterium]|nr:prolipoprotein diacylglyceryl transferase [Saprospiraceae bacterium]